MKRIKWFSDHVLFILVLFLLAFIPLYPKLPLFGINHTWVYIRLEDFIVAFTVFLLGISLIKKKKPWETPLTIPIVIFWVIGGISTLFAIIFIFPHLANVFPNVAFFNYLRQIEYLSVFFVSFAAMTFFKQHEEHKSLLPTSKGITLGLRITTAIYFILFILQYFVSQKPFQILSPVFRMPIFQQHIGFILFCLSYIFFLSTFFKKKISLITAVLGVTVFLTFGYGLGERLFGFPAYLTMNEEFAKGIPLKLSAAARIPSTFAGHYDLAAYLILLIPILGSMVFGFKNIFARISLFIVSLSGVILLLMTASRISFSVYLLTVSFMLLLQKKKLFIIPVLILSFFLLQSFKSTATRFSNTISQVDLVVDARTGKAIGIAKQDTTAQNKNTPKKIVIEDIQSNGENLPQGSGYINLPSSTTQKTATEVEIKRSLIKAGSPSAQITNMSGDFAIKKVLAYDVSFTTRFQGEWPRAMDAFERNVLLGSGYSSISLASDNNYLRMLGETGALGLSAFILIFMVLSIYAYRVLPEVDDRASRSLIIGILAGIFGLSLNAILIDVFEASKVAFVLWVLIGICIGLLSSFHKKKIRYIADLKTVLTSFPAVGSYLIIGAFSIFSISIPDYFVADDFTWLRWAADCKKVLYASGLENCEPVKNTLVNYFLSANGFFYRPGVKMYFYFMYTLFWLNQGAYHVVTILLHITAVTCIYFISGKLLKSRLFGIITAIFFLVLAAHSETLFWISSVGHVLVSVCMLLGLSFFILWKEKKHIIFLPGAVLFTAVAPYFHEAGVVGPLLLISFDLLYSSKAELKKIVTKWYYALFLLPLPVYFSLHMIAKSPFSSGDYSYNLSKLPFNAVGNVLGYIGLTLFGNGFLPSYENLRNFGKGNVMTIFYIFLIGLFLCGVLCKLFGKRIQKRDVQVILAGFFFFIIPLLPFLGLGNIAIRYVYLSSFGILLIAVFLLQKIYYSLRRLNTYAVDIILVLCILLFTYLNISSLYRSNKDWQIAGDLTNHLLVNFSDVFPHSAITINPIFYFVNVPQRNGEAWVFPVGLKDAMWMTFQNENLTVETPPTLNLALDFAEGSTSAKVFQFDKSGNVEEVIRTKTIVPVKNAK